LGPIELTETTPDDPHYGRWRPFAVDGEDRRDQTDGLEQRPHLRAKLPALGRARRLGNTM
jgi:hypothetical protein